MLVTGVRPNEQPGDLEAGEGAHVTEREFQTSVSITASFQFSPPYSDHSQIVRAEFFAKKLFLFICVHFK
jgi:hypothetical protein